MLGNSDIWRLAGEASVSGLSESGGWAWVREGQQVWDPFLGFMQGVGGDHLVMLEGSQVSVCPGGSYCPKGIKVSERTGMHL